MLVFDRYAKNLGLEYIGIEKRQGGYPFFQQCRLRCLEHIQ